MKRIATLVLVLIMFVLIFPVKSMAEIDLGTALLVQINDKNVQDGDIISSDQGTGYIRSKAPYDPFIFGVVAKTPALFLYDKNNKSGIPIISVGKAYVRVSTENGPIKHGDQITSSATPGVGVKAIDNGYVVGTAEESYSATDKNKIGKILVAVAPRFAQLNSNLATTIFSFSRSFSASLLTPLSVMRYMIAGLLVIASFYFGLRFFGYASTGGIEAIGRNPLAKKGIIITVVINSILTLIIMLIGLGIAYLILAF